MSEQEAPPQPLLRVKAGQQVVITDEHWDDLMDKVESRTIMRDHPRDAGWKP